MSLRRSLAPRNGSLNRNSLKVAFQAHSLYTYIYVCRQMYIYIYIYRQQEHFIRTLLSARVLSDVACWALGSCLSTPLEEGWRVFMKRTEMLGKTMRLLSRPFLSLSCWRSGSQQTGFVLVLLSLWHYLGCITRSLGRVHFRTAVDGCT